MGAIPSKSTRASDKPYCICFPPLSPVQRTSSRACTPKKGWDRLKGSSCGCSCCIGCCFYGFIGSSYHLFVATYLAAASLDAASLAVTSLVSAPLVAAAALLVSKLLLFVFLLLHLSVGRKHKLLLLILHRCNVGMQHNCCPAVKRIHSWDLYCRQASCCYRLLGAPPAERRVCRSTRHSRSSIGLNLS